MVVLGIDPGSRRVGYGLIRDDRRRPSLVTAGLLTIKSRNEAAALFELERDLVALIKRYRPKIMVVEKLYFAQNRTTGLTVSQARGVILLVGARERLEIQEFTPREMKMFVTGTGTADKQMVEKMVCLHLGIKPIKLIDDAADALGLALCAATTPPKKTH